MRKAFIIVTTVSAILLLSVVCVFVRNTFVIDDWTWTFWYKPHRECATVHIILAEGALIYSSGVETYPNSEQLPVNANDGYSHNSFWDTASSGEWLGAHGVFEPGMVWSSIRDASRKPGHSYLGICIRIWLWPLVILFCIFPVFWLSLFIWRRFRRLKRMSTQTNSHATIESQ
jgi:hypothetical protein